jgi:anti-anti-sigma factor
MNFQRSVDGDTGLLGMEGAFTFEIHTPFRAHVQVLLDEPGLRRIVVDLEKVEAMDYSSLGLLLLLREMAEKRSMKLILRRPSPGVRGLFDAFHFGKIFELQN